ncbi:insulinase family protein [Olsenella sp. HMSC062G07]|uniref:insulinase family protein n=1 Tax=Olsenella sp. HMSC062G07 TaxID=1739330 RepID=UPI0009F37CC9|nr:insulinase family protein [Olsenella sp. HMSC062G07]
MPQHQQPLDVLHALPDLAVGTRHAGFTVTGVEPLAELEGTAYVLRHDGTGARLMWIATADTNRSFSIAFKTPPADDTGVFHILEHSVLCGSDRFPVKEPFVSLIKTSMQTFLNALTFPDKTMYPVASTNVQDLENLMDVYLDAVLHPAIYRRPRIFEQEGWHLELAGGAEGGQGDAAVGGEQGGAIGRERLVYNGVVYNEMKGALSDPDEVLMEALMRQLFPRSAYGFESGGDPRSIPDLSYEDFLDTHARHYDLANSYTILYGDLDIERELAFVGARFDAATPRAAGAPNPLRMQEPVAPAPLTITMATTPDNASVGVAYVLGTAADRELVLATSVLIDALCGSNEAPLKRAVLDAGLADDFRAILMDSLLQPLVVFELKGARKGAAAAFQPLLEKVCRELAEGGIERGRLVASLAQTEFELREGDWGYPDGVARSILAMASWLYDDERPVDYLRYQDAIDAMRARLDEGYFEGVLRGLVLESRHHAQVELVPVDDESAGDDARRREARLAERAARLGSDERRAIHDEVAALRAEQEAPDRPEDLAKLPRLGIKDIADAPRETPPEQADAPLPCLYHDLATHRIDYVYHYFDLRRLEAADLPYVGLLTELLGNLDTASHTASELDTLVEEKLGSFSVFTDSYGRDDDPLCARPVLTVAASALSENVGSLASLPAEIWGTTSFADTGRIFEQLQQRRVALGQYFASSGHSAALARLSTHFSNAAKATDLMGGVSYYLFLKDLLEAWDERKDALRERLEGLSRRVFTSDEVVVSFTGPREDLEAFWAAGGALGLAPAGKSAARHRLDLGKPRQEDEAVVIPANVCFVAAGAPRASHDAVSLGAWQVADRALSFDYLWNKVRVKGGAYGVGFRRTTSGLRQFWSFRDPGVTDTLARYDAAGDWLASWDGSTEELEGYVVSCVAGHDGPLKPRRLARRQDGEHLMGRPAGWRDRIRAQILATRAADLRDAGRALSDLKDSRSVCVFGPQEAVGTFARRTVI